MGTFTISYFLRTAVWEKRNLWAMTAVLYYFGKCWDRAGMDKAEMMKGHSRMYAHRVASLPKGADPWKY